MAEFSPNIHLILTPESSGSKTFREFRMELAGDNSDSNMMLIDAAVKSLQDGKYELPDTGIPADDLSSDVQESLNKADTALQEHQDISGKLSAYQGTDNAGKVMTVNSAGFIVPITPGGGGDPVQITIGDVDGLQAALDGKVGTSDLQSAINSALQEAAESGDFDGDTPVKGVDYWTDSDKQEIVNDVLSALEVWTGGDF